MSQAIRRKIEQLRAKAASTTFPHERSAFNAKADRLEAKLKTEPEASPFEYAPAAPMSADERLQNRIREAMRQHGAMHSFAVQGDPLKSPHFGVRIMGAPVLPNWWEEEQLPPDKKKLT